MPIKPENRARYPKDWKRIREEILKRADNKCEFCGVENHTMRLNPKTGKEVRIILTIAHLDHIPENCDLSNLRALCQKCHNTYDAKHRAEIINQHPDPYKKIGNENGIADKCDVAHQRRTRRHKPIQHQAGIERS